MLLWYRGRHFSNGVGDWFQCDSDDFKKLLSNAVAQQNYTWFDVRCERGNYKVLKVRNGNDKFSRWWWKKI